MTETRVHIALDKLYQHERLKATTGIWKAEPEQVSHQTVTVTKTECEGA